MRKETKVQIKIGGRYVSHLIVSHRPKFLNDTHYSVFLYSGIGNYAGGDCTKKQLKKIIKQLQRLYDET